jgi:hypothetical protein
MSSNGPIAIAGEFLTDGPLSDIYSNDVIKAGKEKATFTGDLISAVAIETADVLNKPTPSDGHAFKVVSERVEIRPKTVADVLGTNPSERSKPVSEGVLENDPLRKVSVLKGEDVLLSEPLQVDGDLRIEVRRLTINAPLLVKGNVVAMGNVSVDLSSPFEDAVVVDGNFEANNLTVVGKMNVGGSFTSHGVLDLVGSMVIGGGITLQGKTKISYVDTIYKAALFAAQQHFGETLLLHSQIFKNVKGANTVALFTFARGYQQSSEAFLLERIRTKEITPEDYFSVVMGASGQYATELVRYEGVAPYYYSKVAVIDILAEKGYQNLAVVEAINASLDLFYLTFREKGGDIIGTYLIGPNNSQQASSDGYSASDAKSLIELTLSDRELLAKAIDNAEQTHKDTVEERNREIQNLPVEEQGGQQKALFGPEQASLEDPRSPEEARTEEWRFTKNLPEERQEATIVIEIIPDPEDSLTLEEKQKGRMKGCCKKLLNRVNAVIQSVVATTVGNVKAFAVTVRTEVKKIVQPPCKKIVDRKMIAGVDETQNDIWTREIAVLNSEGNNCSPTSATMILRYHGRNRGNAQLYRDAVNDAVGRTYPSGLPISGNDLRSSPFNLWRLTLLHDLRNQMMTSTKWGTMPWNMAFGTKELLSRYNIPGNATWLVAQSGIDAGSYIGMSRLFAQFEWEVAANRPAMFNVIGGGWPSSKWKAGHTMPVLGTRKEYYSGICSISPFTDKHWLYVHSTWGIGDKRWYRFDRYQYPLALWDGVAIKIY